MTKLHVVYVLLDEKGNVFYVGKTNNPLKRFNRHLGHVRRGSCYPVHNKLRKVLTLISDISKLYKVIEYNISEHDIDSKEMFYIKFYRNLGFKLKNLTDGGEGGKGFTSEMQKCAAEKRRGIPKSEICKQRISRAKQGIPLSNEHKKSLKNAWKTRTSFGPEHYKKISQLNRGIVNIKKYEILSPLGKLMITMRGLTDFCREHNLSAPTLWKTLSGERRHHKGWKLVREIKSS